MALKDLTEIDQTDQFLTGIQIFLYDVLSSKDELDKRIQNTLKRFKYPSMSKREKGVLIR